LFHNFFDPFDDFASLVLRLGFQSYAIVFVHHAREFKLAVPEENGFGQENLAALD
jgi:hypothetical protein